MSKGINGASRDSVLLICVKLVTMLLGIVTTRILSEQLSVTEYGTYSQIMLLVSTVSSLTILGMADGVNYFYCRENASETREAYVSTVFSLQYIVSLLAAIVVLVCTVPISVAFGNADLKSLMIFAALLPLLQNMIAMLQVLFVSIGKARQIAARNLIISALRLLLFGLACYMFKSVSVILIFTLALDILQIGYFLIVLYRNDCKIRLCSTDFSLMKSILSYCVPMAVFLILNTLCRDCDKYVVALLTDTETLAIYTNAAKVLPFDIIMASFVTVLLPYITRYIAAADFEKARGLYKEFIELSYVTTSILAATVIVAAPQVMTLLYTEKYLQGISVFIVYIVVDIFRFTNITLILSAAGKTKILMFVSAGALAGNLLLNIVLYHVCGILGPAIATLIVILVLGAVIMNRSAAALESKVSDFFDRRFLLTFSLEIVAGIGLCTVLRMWLQHVGVHDLLIAAIVCAVFASGMLALNAKRLLRCIKAIDSYKLHG